MKLERRCRKKIFYNLYFLGNTIILEKNDEFSIKDERIYISRRQISMKTTLKQKYIVFLQATSIQVAARAASRHIEQASKKIFQRKLAKREHFK